MKALLIRHGETDWNKSGKFLGQYDVPLNDRGLAQARETAEAVAADGPAALYSSPLARTMRLAEEVSRLTDLPVNPMPGLKELDLGDMEGLTGAELRERWPDFFSEWRKDPGPVLMPGGESLAQLQDRAWSAFEEIEAVHRGDERLVVVSHNFTIRTIISRILGIPWSNFHNMALDLASISTVESNERGRRLVTYNSTCHLSPENL